MGGLVSLQTRPYVPLWAAQNVEEVVWQEGDEGG
jgi:hypothetical protein